MVPNAEQQAAIDAIDNGRNVLITGPAGTGKSFVLDKLKKKLKRRLAVTSTTGVAALLVGGSTIHAWAGLGIGDDSAERLAQSLLRKRTRAYDRIINAEILAIDEASMLSGEMVTKIDHYFRIVRETEEPFGGIQMIFIGDFLQLPPVDKKFIPQPMDDDTPRKENLDGRYAFESRSWAEAEVVTHELKTIVRQKDAAFAAVLNKIRIGLVDDHVKSVLNSRIGIKPCTKDGVRPVKLYSTNASVDAINASELAKIESKEQLYTAKYQGFPWAIDNIKKNCMASEFIKLKVGAQVMLLRNIDLDAGLVNGSLGVVSGFPGGIPRVDFANGQSYTCEPEIWEIKDGDTVLASVEQIPLRLAYAITQHKSQGSTMDKVELDLSNCFEYGQAYVALSRCRTLEGMYITKMSLPKIRACPVAKKFYGYE